MKEYPNVTGLRCTICGRLYQAADGLFVCPDHGVDGTLDVEYDYASIGHAFTRNVLAQSQDFSQWRYRPLLPVDEMTAAPPLRVGWTPLEQWHDARKRYGIKALYLKDETHQPTGSLKDRASALAVMKAQEAGAQVITTASTGNAAAALAGMCAAAGIPSVIFVPASAPKAKLAQLIAYGATVFLVDGTYDHAFDLCLEAADAFGWYNRNTGYNPYMAEGKKTAAFEICEQLGWRAPSQVYVGVGDGCIISGLYKGFYDLLQLGWIESIPKLMGVQAAGSDFMWQAARKGADIVTFPPISAQTKADSISAGLPRDRIKASRAVQKSGGEWLRVEDHEILAAIPKLASATGIFAEPAAAASFAGFEQALECGLVSPDEDVVLLITGNGLKDINAVTLACADGGNTPITVAPTLDAVKRKLPEDGGL